MNPPNELQIPVIVVSPHFELDTKTLIVTEYSDQGEVVSTYAFEDKALPIRIYRDRMAGWFFDVAQRLMEQRQDVAAVHMITPLIEALEEHMRGQPSRGKSAEFFKAGVRRLFNLTDPQALNLIYGGLRCGFAHHGFLKDDDNHYNILLSNGGLSEALVYRDKVLIVDTEKYVSKVREAFEKFYDELSTEPAKMEKFLKLWNEDWQMSLRVPGAGGVLAGGRARRSG